MGDENEIMNYSQAWQGYRIFRAFASLFALQQSMKSWDYFEPFVIL